MIRRHVLAALTAGVQAGDDEVARASLADIDWVLRGLARRRLERAMLDAALAVGTGGDESIEDVRHRLRAAALITLDKQVGDRDAVEDAYSDIVVTKPPRLPIATSLVAVAGVLLAMFVGFSMVRAITASAANGDFTRPTPPAPGGAYRDGGTPQLDPALEQVLSTDLMALENSYVRDEAEYTQRLNALRNHAAFAAHGDELARSWRNMIETYARWRSLGGSAHAAHRDAWRVSKELFARVAVVSDQLSAAGLGYFLDVEVGEDSRRTPGLYAFRVEEVGFVRANDERVRVLGLRRMHRSESNVILLGMTTSEPRDPVVLLDEVDEKVRTQIIPVLGGHPYVVGDELWARTARGRRVSMAVTEAIRRELHTALGSDVQSLDAATARCKKLVAASIRHHEAQHGFDRDRKLRYPASLAPHAGPENQEFAIRTRHEISGYLSQIASDTWLPQLVLWNLSRHAFRDQPRPVEEAYVAAFIIEGLARHLKIPSVGAVVTRGQIDRDRLSTLSIAIAERSTTELRSAAAALWTEAFGSRLVRIVDDL